MNKREIVRLWRVMLKEWTAASKKGVVCGNVEGGTDACPYCIKFGYRGNSGRLSCRKCHLSKQTIIFGRKRVWCQFDNHRSVLSTAFSMCRSGTHDPTLSKKILAKIKRDKKKYFPEVD